jgi:cell wall-associated NlpC family hydrolase
MSRTPGEVLKRALTAIAGVLVALTVTAALAHPAGAAGSGRDVLAETATRTLTDLRGVRVAQVAAALAGGSANPSTAVAVYQADLAELAAVVAGRSGTPADAFVQAWSTTTPVRMTVMLSALGQAGVPYHSMASSPGSGFDCSGLTMYAWSQAGVALPHRDSTQMNESTPRTWETAQTADLVQYPGHVMLYLGAGQAIVHAPNTGSVVRVQDISRSVRLASPLG